jgi:NAD(P)-dependent dehydrogenase (short-subunit alcohol dehydrogenase family)
LLVNNAGTALQKPFAETLIEEMDRVIYINFRGLMVATQSALKHMKSGGRIINIGSAVGERVAAPGLVPYAGTKGAVKMFTQAFCEAATVEDFDNQFAVNVRAPFFLVQQLIPALCKGSSVLP